MFMDKYDDYFIENATIEELEAAGNEVYNDMWKHEFGSPEYEELSSLHQKIVNRKLELSKNPNPDYHWTDKNRWE